VLAMLRRLNATLTNSRPRYSSLMGRRPTYGMGVTRYVASAGELHFRCRFCGESVFLPEVAIERVERR